MDANKKETLLDYNLQSNAKLTTLSFDNEEDWLALRTKGIGGSDIGAIMGLNQYSSPLKVYKQKVEGYKEDLSDNVFVQKGKDLEDLILTKYVQPHLSKLGFSVGKPKFMIINSDYPYFRANVDGIAFKENTSFKDNLIVEIKVVSEWAECHWNGSEYNGIPASYYAQVQLYMLVTGAQSAIVCALFDTDWEMHYYSVPRNENFIAAMIKAGHDFYQYHMMMKIPPRLSMETDKAEVCEAIKEAPKATTPSPEMTMYVEKYLANQEKIKKAEEVQSKIKDLILDFANKGFCPTDPKHKVKTTVVTQRRINANRLKEEDPATYEKYLEDSTYPKITIK